MTRDQLETLLTRLRPRLHRYAARMTGSSVDGEDVVQETALKAWAALTAGAVADSPEAWLFRIAHNASLDLLRRRVRHRLVPLDEGPELAALPDTELDAISFHSFLRLPELQRCAVILKDVLGHSVEEVAAIAGCSPAAAKSALQRGRHGLRQLAALPPDARLPLMSTEERDRMAAFVAHFRAGEFDAIRALLAENVRVELVNRLSLTGKAQAAPYFTRYGAEPKWRFAFGSADGHPAMLVFDHDDTSPAHFVLLDWQDGRISRIRDFLFAPYATEALDWALLG